MTPAPSRLRTLFLGIPSMAGDALPWLAWVVMALAALPQLMYPLWFDQGAFAACGAALHAGGIFLRDCWEARGPLTPLLYAIPMTFSAAPIAVRLFDVLWQMATAVLLGMVTRDLFGRTAGNIAALVYFLMYASLNYWATAQAEGFANGLFIGAVWLVWRATGTTGDGKSKGIASAFRLPWLLAAGFVAGLLFWSKYPFALLAVALAVWTWRRSGFGAVTRYAGGVAAALLLGLVYFAGNGLLTELGQHLQYAISTFNNVPLAQRWEWFTGIFWVEVKAFVSVGNIPTAGYKDTVIAADHVLGRGYPILMILALVGAVYGLIGKEIRRATLLALVYWGVAFALQVWQGHSYRYHFVILLPPFALLIGAATRGRDGGLLSIRRWLAYLPVLAVFVAAYGMCVAIWPWTRDAINNLIIERKPINQVYAESRVSAYSTLGDFLRLKSAPGESVFVFGDTPAVYALAERPMGARFPYLRWAKEGGDPAVRQAYTAALLADLQAHRPRFFALPTVGMPSNDFDFQQIWKEMTPVHDFVEANYGYIGEVGPYLLFERK